MLSLEWTGSDKESCKNGSIIPITNSGIELKDGQNRDEHMQRQHRLGCTHRA